MRAFLLPHPILTSVLTLVWMLLANSFSLGHLVLGLVLGWAIPVFTQHFWPEKVRIRHPLRLVAFIGRVLSDILTANLTVARIILQGPDQAQPGFVRVPLDLRSDLAISLLANTISLTPGTLSAWLNPERDTLIVHALRVEDPGALITEIKSRYERPLKEIFES